MKCVENELRDCVVIVEDSRRFEIERILHLFLFNYNYIKWHKAAIANWTEHNIPQQLNTSGDIYWKITVKIQIVSFSARDSDTSIACLIPLRNLPCKYLEARGCSVCGWRSPLDFSFFASFRSLMSNLFRLYYYDVHSSELNLIKDKKIL